MKKFEGMLFCSDLDGTLFSKDKTVSKQNLEAIEYFKSEGGLFTFITGRMPKTSKEICDIVKPNAPYGCINGGGIYDHREGKYLWNIELPKEALELVKHVEEQLPDMGISLNTESNVYFRKDNSAMVYMRSVTGLSNITCTYDDLDEILLKVAFGHDDEEQMLSLIKLLNNHPKASCYDFIRTERRLYEILPKGVNKGLALKKMADLLGVNMSKTIAVGDYNNDISMIQEAGIGIAVANAVDEVKAVADYITVSNNENAIATIIDGLDKGKFKAKF